MGRVPDAKDLGRASVGVGALQGRAVKAGAQGGRAWPLREEGRSGLQRRDGCEGNGARQTRSCWPARTQQFILRATGSLHEF